MKLNRILRTVSPIELNRAQFIVTTLVDSISLHTPVKIAGFCGKIVYLNKSYQVITWDRY